MSENKAIIENVLKLIAEKYIITEKIEAICSYIRKQLKSGTYIHLSCEELAATLTRQLIEVSNDLHFRAVFSEQPLPARDQIDEESPEEIENYRREVRLDNFGCHKLERLAGNVGYWRIRAFPDLIDFSEKTFMSCMGFLSNSDSLIIDVRDNPGGDAEAVCLVSSFLFDIEPVHLFTDELKQGASLRKYWTIPHISHERFLNKDVFVLVNKKSFSAPELFAYSLQALGRAVVVGQPTAGAAHMSEQFRISDHILLNIPIARPVTPVSRSNWEGSGVQPDIMVPEEDILETAHFLSIKRLEERTATDQLLLKEVKSVLNGFEETFESAYHELTQLISQEKYADWFRASANVTAVENL